MLHQPRAPVAVYFLSLPPEIKTALLHKRKTPMIDQSRKAIGNRARCRVLGFFFPSVFLSKFFSFLSFKRVPHPEFCLPGRV
jgi:hypothetical protein